MLVTRMPRARAAARSTTLYPVASTPTYRRSGQAANTASFSTVLLVRATWAPWSRGMVCSGWVKSWTTSSPNWAMGVQDRSPGLAAEPSRMTMRIARLLSER